jgi:hypothetical protein
MYFLRDEGRRADRELAALSGEAIMATIRRAICFDRGQSAEKIAADERRFRPLVVSPAVDVFDPWFIVLVESAACDTLVRLYEADEAVVHSVELRPRELGDVLRQFIAELNRQAGPHALNPL